MTTRRLPARQAQTLVACRRIVNDSQAGEIVIVGLVGHVRCGLVEPVPPWDWRASEKRR